MQRIYGIILGLQGACFALQGKDPKHAPVTSLEMFPDGSLLSFPSNVPSSALGMREIDASSVSKSIEKSSTGRQDRRWVVRYQWSSVQLKEKIKKSDHKQCHASLTKQLGLRSVGQVCDGPFLNQTQDTLTEGRIALVLRGESFRSGAGQHDGKITVTPESWKRQREASISHVSNVIEPLEACGWTVDVFIETYKMELDPTSNITDPVNDLASFYGERVNSIGLMAIRERREAPEFISIGDTVVPSNVHMDANIDHNDPTNSNQVANANRAMQLVVDNHNKAGVTYDGILMTRMDVIFKKSVPDLERVDWTKINFAFHEWGMGGGRAGNSPQRIPDIVVWYPWAYENCAIKAGFGEHTTWSSLYAVMPIQAKQDNSVRFMIEEFHDADSWIDRNPLYRLIRAEQKYDVNGGVAVLVAGVKDKQTIQEFLDVKDHLFVNLKMQGDPALVPADFYVHHWAQEPCTTNKDDGAPWVEVWGARDHFQTCGNYAEMCSIFDALVANKTVPDATLLELFAWGHSLLNGTKRMQSIQHRDTFIHDQVVVARDDYIETYKHNQVPGFDVSKVHAGFDATVAPWVPSMLILSSEHAVKLATAVQNNSWPAFHLEDGSSRLISTVMAWIGDITGAPVVSPNSPGDLGFKDEPDLVSQQ